MKQFLLRLVRLYKDKVYHFFCSYTAMLTFTSLAIIKWESSVAWSINFGVAMAILVGVAKEFFDLYVKKSKFSVGDIIADVLGIALAFLIVGV
mgnify:CR=1 FL=1